MDEEFADPTNLDFHLQADSRFREAGPDGSDQGPFPYQENIYYVSPGGDDTADGVSTAEAWLSLARSTKSLAVGDTIYLETEHTKVT